MKFKICNGKYDDYFLVEGENLDEVLEKIRQETVKRGWEDKDCWDELIEE